jgi:hypothetical protein
MAFDTFASAVLPWIAGGLILSWLMEYRLAPGMRAPWRRPLAACIVHIGLWCALCAFTLFVWRRPFFMLFNALVLQAIVIGVSHVKYKTLREVFVYPDFEYFTDMLRHPRLYLPFFGVGLAIACFAGYGVIVALDVWLEAPLTDLWPIETYVGAIVLFFAGILVARIAAGSLPDMTFEANADTAHVGLAAALLLYRQAEQTPTTAQTKRSPFAQQASSKLPILPNVVTIQSESFFDIRHCYPQIRTDILAGFDRLCAQSLAHGRLHVAAWGANTVRTEFAFLSGIAPADLAVHRYNPYRSLARKGFPTIASYMRQLGYRTVCVHPYTSAFYSRAQVYPLLGFDTFLDINDFVDPQYDGQYISDLEVSKKVAALLATTHDQPVYVHVITMENHGPLHWDRVDDEDFKRLTVSHLKTEHRDLVAYARHLGNADLMFEQVAQSLKDAPRPGAMCIYGDHVPIMEKVYRDLGEPDGMTDYLIWSTQQSNSSVPSDMSVDALSVLLLERVGLSKHVLTADLAA